MGASLSPKPQFCPCHSGLSLMMKRPTPRFRWKPSKLPMLPFGFGVGELAAIVSILTLVGVVLVLSAIYPLPWKSRELRSGFGLDWDCAADPASWGPVCVKRIHLEK